MVAITNSLYESSVSGGSDRSSLCISPSVSPGRGGARCGPAPRAVDRAVHSAVPDRRLRAPCGADGARRRPRRRAGPAHSGRDGAGAAAQRWRAQVGRPPGPVCGECWAGLVMSDTTYVLWSPSVPAAAECRPWFISPWHRITDMNVLRS